MKKESHESWDVKTKSIFERCFPEGIQRPMPLEEITAALRAEFGEQTAQDIAFHLCDWREEAVFLVAPWLDPAAFTRQEIKNTVTASRIHIPNHVAAAAKLGGCPMKDIFCVVATIEPADVAE